MELKDFQQSVLDTFSGYLDELVAQHENWLNVKKVIEEKPDLNIHLQDFTEDAWNQLRAANKLPQSRQAVPFSPRLDGTGRHVPSVCLKIPTGGGKTLLAAHAVSRLLGQWNRSNKGFVLWIVPSEAIYSQTIKALKNREHPYRQVLDQAAAGRVKIFEKMDRLDRRDIENHLCIMLLMLQSSNRQNKETLKVFKDRGNVHGFFPAPDDGPAQEKLMGAISNLDIYSDVTEHSDIIVKESLGNALRVIRPIVVLDEGHKGYSKLAMKTLYGFNPKFVLELTATPIDRAGDTPPVYSNWLVDVRGTDLEKEEMIKLPINVTIEGGDDWRDTLRKSFERLNTLQKDADRLRADTARYIRPICLIQVERTGTDQRDGQFIHSDDAKEFLLTLGVRDEEIAIKTSQKNELNQPENQDLLSPKNQIRFIITKHALQEGWDCPFAYVLCSLAPVTAHGAMTQIMGRILRQPETVKTGVSALDECYVLCHHSTTKDVVDAIKYGLEKDGMGDLAENINATSGDNGDGLQSRKIKRREQFEQLKVFLPQVLWVDGNIVRPLEYEADILYNLDWSDFDLDGIQDDLPNRGTVRRTQVVQIDFLDDSNDAGLINTTDMGSLEIQAPFDTTHATRSISDLIPNPWVARQHVQTVVELLEQSNYTNDDIAGIGEDIISKLRQRINSARDQKSEILFRQYIDEGKIQFHLRADRNNWEMPRSLLTDRPLNSDRLRRDDGREVLNSLFEPFYKDDLNNYEQGVACYLDGDEAINWWHRNVAKAQSGYSLQGWKKQKIYPDFIFALSVTEDHEHFLVLESKGDHLDNPDTAYKKDLMQLCTEAFKVDGPPTVGQLEVVGPANKTFSCALVFQDTWNTNLRNVIDGQIGA